MPRIKVNDVTLAYEVFGEGTPMVWTPGGWFARDPWVYLNAGRFCANCRVLIWDRRNCGASDVAIEEAPSDYHLWADDLHFLLDALEMSPAYVAGGSAGHVLSLLMAHRYPEDVKGLVLQGTPTDDADLRSPLVESYYLRPAKEAESRGMQAVIDHSTQAWARMVSSRSKPGDWDGIAKGIAEAILMNPGNRGRLLSMDPHRFAAIMRKWADWMLSGRFHLSGLSDEVLRSIAAPTIIAHGFDDLHPRHTAEELHGLLPNSDWVEYSDYYSQERIDEVRVADNEGNQRAAMCMPVVERFL